MKVVRVCVAQIIVSLSLAGCVSTQTVANHLGGRYVGTSFDDFVIARGPPKTKFSLSNGDTAYVWNSAVASVHMPMTATSTTTGNVTDTTIQGGGSLNMFCEVQFVTSPAGTIKGVTILQDTIGWWTTSRCHEIFE